MFQHFLQSANYLAIITSAIAVFALGALWYSPLLFANAWMKCIGKSPEELRGGAKSYYLFTLIAILVYCFVTSFFVWILGTDEVFEAIKLGGFIGIGYVLT